MKSNDAKRLKELERARGSCVSIFILSSALIGLVWFSWPRRVFIDPGSPWQNAWMESFNRTGGKTPTPTTSLKCPQDHQLVEPWNLIYRAIAEPPLRSARRRAAVRAS
jgi:hypothetical protein